MLYGLGTLSGKNADADESGSGESGRLRKLVKQLGVGRKKWRGDEIRTGTELAPTV